MRLTLDLLELSLTASADAPLPPPPPPMRSTLDLLVLRFFPRCVAPLPPPPPPIRSLVLRPPPPGKPNCASADDPRAITKAVVTTASTMPLKRTPMTILPKPATAPCRLTGTVLAPCRQGHGGFGRRDSNFAAKSVGWVERSETHHLSSRKVMGFAKGSTHPTGFTNERGRQVRRLVAVRRMG